MSGSQPVGGTDENRGVRLAMVMCVRDEERIIEQNLRYHHALGVEKAYVFTDLCSDRTEAILARLPWVEVTPFRRSPDADYTTQQDVQGPCAHEALERTHAEGFDWLMHVDADEFAFAGNPARDPVEQGCLTTMLARVAPATEQVRMRTIEAVPLKGQPACRQWEHCYFQEDGNVLCREMLHPVTREIVKLTKWMGHNQGKSIVRPGPGIVSPSQHRFVYGDRETGEVERELETENIGFHAHFFLDGPDHWIDKFRKSAWVASSWAPGIRVPFPIQAWKEYSQICSDAEARAYYEDWIAIEERLARDLERDGQLTRRTVIRDIVNRVMEEAAA